MGSKTARITLAVALAAACVLPAWAAQRTVLGEYFNAGW